MIRTRRTRMVCTLGPASRSPDKVEALARAGADVFRLNFSHGSHDDHQKTFDVIREVEKIVDRPLGVLADLQGPKFRLGTFAAGRIAVRQGQAIRLDLDPAPGDDTRVYVPHPEILAALKPGTLVLIDDGKVRLRVERADGKSADTV